MAFIGLNRLGLGVPSKATNMFLLINRHHTTLSTFIFYLIRFQIANSYP
jgi:hypothetical protein